MLKKRELWKNRSYYMMILPAIIVFFLFSYLPMPGIIIAFKDYNFMDGIFGSPFIGLENFKFFFMSEYAWRTTFNTLWINANNIFWGTFIAVMFAIMLNEMRNMHLKKLYQNLMFIPYFLSVIILSRIVGMIFNNEIGIANRLIEFLGGDPISWTTEAKHWVKIIVGTNIWKGVGYGVIIYLSTIVGIDKGIYESSYLDGANRLQMIRYITLPLLVPVIIILTLLSIGRIFFGDFQTIYAIVGNNGALLETTDIIETYVFRAVKNSAEFSMAGAVGMYQSVVGFIVILGSNTLVKLYNKDYSLF
ncbi:MAG: ABC transporter permease subunit [Clostridia bacterium]|nr:ABC transporter permease subunit [Clostridia bacterium]